MDDEALYKQAPETLADCTKDETAGLLMKWADRLQLWGGALCFLLIVIGLFVAAGAASEIDKYSDKGTTTVFFTTIATWVIGGILSYLVFRIASLGIEALANITLNTAVTANLALFEAKQKYCYMQTPDSQEAPPWEENIEA